MIAADVLNIDKIYIDVLYIRINIHRHVISMN